MGNNLYSLVKQKYNMNNEYIEKDDKFINKINEKIEYVRNRVIQQESYPFLLYKSRYAPTVARNFT